MVHASITEQLITEQILNTYRFQEIHEGCIFTKIRIKLEVFCTCITHKHTHIYFEFTTILY